MDVNVYDDRGEEGGGAAEKLQAPFKGELLYAQIRDAHSWYCDNLLGDEEKTVKAKLKQKTVT